MRVITILLVAAALAAGCGGGGSQAGALESVSGSEPVAKAFNRDAGHARLVLLLSPT